MRHVFDELKKMCQRKAVKYTNKVTLIKIQCTQSATYKNTVICVRTIPPLSIQCNIYVPSDTFRLPVHTFYEPQ